MISVKVVGTERYQPDDVVHATGLQLGQTVHEDDFQAAARLLGDSGAFRDVAYSFQYSPEGTKLELEVKDASQFVPVYFENLVWFSDQDLQQKLHAHVPLFNGQLPVTGELPDQVSQALQAILITNNIKGSADYVRVAHPDGPTEAFAYSVAGPHITIRNIGFSGVDPAELPSLQAAAQKLQGAEYVRSALHAQADKNFLPVYRARGYLKADFGDTQANVVHNHPPEVQVDVTFPVRPGLQYKLAALDLSGNQAFPSQTLRQLIPLTIAQPLNGAQLADDLDAIKALYGTRGYVAVTITSEMEFDHAQSSVNVRIVVAEGAIYKMGDLDILGLDSKATSRLQNNWTLHSGDIYDASYPARFVQEADKELGGEWTASLHQTPNPKDKTVDVTLRFRPKP